MKKKILLVSILAVFMLLSISFASAIQTNNVDIDKKANLGIFSKILVNRYGPSSTYGNLTFKIVTDKKAYKMREPVRVSLQLTNTGNEEITIGTPDGITHDFVVVTMYWGFRYRWSEGMGSDQSWHEIKIPAGETHYWNETWNQKGKLFDFMPLIFRRQVRPGIYYIIGIIPQILGYEKYIDYTCISISR